MKTQSKKPHYNYTEYKPINSVKDLVEKIWVFDSVIDSLDDPHFGLIPDYTSSLIIIIPHNNLDITLFLTGPNTHNIQFNTNPEQITIGLRFYPGKIFNIFGLHPSDIINKIVAMESICDKTVLNSLISELISLTNIRKKAVVLCRFVSGIAASNTLINDDITAAINTIVAADGSVKLEDLYHQISISPRQFLRNFTKRTGLTPKEFSRIVRFHKVTRKLVKNNFMHFDTLVESGYYDQSHYYREFKEFLGMLPGKFESRQKKIDYKELLK